MRVVAVDWSGKRKRAEEAIWLAEVRDGQLLELSNGRSREDLVDHLLAMGEDEGELAIGLDFAFSFPAWWCRERGWSSARAVWSAMAAEGEAILEACEPPFWGRAGRRNPHAGETQFRATELEGVVRAKSVFQIGGAGAVGTGSIRGMPHLAAVASHGFGIWPFADEWPRILEIYPRALTGPVNKSCWADRHAHLFETFPDQPADLLERAAGSEDAFDAAVSALVMSRHETELRDGRTSRNDTELLEGRIWRPEVAPRVVSGSVDERL